ncbi:MAG: hypothetical protein ACTSYH_03440 [Candidatus Heimdallarchaeaceae archaeon]
MSKIKFGGIFFITCVAPDGTVKWKRKTPNIVVNEGLQHVLDVVFNGDDSSNTNIDPWYVGLVDGSSSSVTYSASDTLSSHSGWSENSNYSGNRKEYDGTRISQTVSNSSSLAEFVISSDSQEIYGAFLCSVSSGTSGVLLSVATFSGGEETADSGDTIRVTYEFTASDDGA